MKFKMGSSKPGAHADHLHDSTSTSSSIASNNINQQSGIYDISRMTNLRTPADPSKYTTQRAKENASRDKKNSELIRGLLLAVAIPLVVGAGYLILSGADLSFRQTLMPDLAVETTEPARAPATSATLPVVQVDATPAVKTTLTLSQIASTSLPNQPTSGSKTKPLAIVLDENGNMTSPFSAELDGEGNEVARLEFKDYVTFLAPLPLGHYENVKTLREARPTDEFLRLTTNKNVYKYDAEEVRRFSLLRGQAQEVRSLLEIYEAVARSRMGIQPIAIDSFSGYSASPAQLEAATNDLKWLEPTIVLSQAIGTNFYDARLKETVLEWVKNYKPSGIVTEDIRLAKVAMAFEVIQHLMNAEEVEKCKEFFLRLADTQFIQMKAHKLYDPTHAFHIDFMATLGAATKDPRILQYAAIQYGFHIERSPIFKLGAFDRDHFQIIGALLNTTFIFDRLGFTFFQNQNGQQSLLHGISIVLNSSPNEGQRDYIQALAAAGYFEPAVYPALSKASLDRTNRFGTTHGTTLAALRKPTTSLRPSTARIPSSLPKKRGR
jgi:hypothetical protein